MSVFIGVDKEQAKQRAALALLNAMTMAGTKGMMFCGHCGGVVFRTSIVMECQHQLTYPIDQMSVTDLHAFSQMVQEMLDTGALVFRHKW